MFNALTAAFRARLQGSLARSCLFGLVIAAALSGIATAPRAQDLPPIRIATEGARPPINFVGPDGEPAGFEIDLGRALCEAAQRRCVFVLRDWEGIVKGLLGGEYDAIMAFMAVTPKRKLKMAFSRPYFRMPASFIARKESDLKGVSPAEFAGKTIGVAEHSEYQGFLDQRYGSSEIRTYDKAEDADLDLLTSRIDLVLADKLTLTRFLESREGTCCRLVGDVPRSETALGQGVAIGLRPGDAALKQTFDAAIAKVMADGSYDRIRAKYVPFDTK